MPKVSRCREEVLLVTAASACSSSVEPPSPTALAFKTWTDQYELAHASFELNAGALAYTKAGADCNQMQFLYQTGGAFPPTGDSSADVAWKLAMASLVRGISVCATAANFRDAGGLGRAGEDFAAASRNMQVAVESLGG